jgi:hypothetical protein
MVALEQRRESRRTPAANLPHQLRVAGFIHESMFAWLGALLLFAIAAKGYRGLGV